MTQEKIEVQTITYEDKKDYRSGLSVLVNGKARFSIFEGEPEDMTLGRDVKTAYSVGKIMKEFYEYGKNGTEVVFILSETKDWEELL